MGDFIGPALPPHLLPPSAQVDDGSCSPEAEVVGPALPPDSSLRKNDTSERTESTDRSGSPTPNDGCTGPTSSEPLEVSQRKSDNLDSEEGGADMYGPALPPGLTARSSSRVLGPSLPRGFRPAQGDDSSSSSSDGEVVGPLPPSESPLVVGRSDAQEALERRAQALKRKFTSEAECSETDGVQRESWMLELPPDRAKEFGLGPRQFRRREAQDVGDRSVWTDTPEDRANKKHSRKDEAENEMRQTVLSARDTEMESLVKKHGKGRDKEKSLLDEHQEKLKKKKQMADNEGKPIERRPFDRNIDLQANRFDEAQKKSIFKKAQLLNDRFSRGESKFL